MELKWYSVNNCNENSIYLGRKPDWCIRVFGLAERSLTKYQIIQKIEYIEDVCIFFSFSYQRTQFTVINCFFFFLQCQICLVHPERSWMSSFSDSDVRPIISIRSDINRTTCRWSEKRDGFHILTQQMSFELRQNVHSLTFKPIEVQGVWPLIETRPSQADRIDSIDISITIASCKHNTIFYAILCVCVCDFLPPAATILFPSSHILFL